MTARIHEIDGHMFSDLDIFKIMLDGDRTEIFKPGGFILSFFYHMLYFFVPFFISVPLIYLFEGCNLNIPANFSLMRWDTGDGGLHFIQMI